MATEDIDEQTTIFTEPVERIQCSQCGHVVDLRGVQPFSDRFCPSCGAKKKVPARLGPYLLLDCIGSGGMGAVFRGLDPSLDRIVAVKVMNRTLGQDPAAIASFRKEARAAARFSHPHAAQIFTFGESHGQPYIVMEFVAGRPISALIKESGTLDQALTVRVGMQTAEALAVAAAAGLLHGDVKPENILVEESGQSKLIDFGLAVLAEQQPQDHLWGSPFYIPPERIERQKTDFRSDIYSLGVTLYEALTGRPPFKGSSIQEVLNAHLAGTPTAVSVYRRDLDPEIERIVMRMMRRQPVDRYPNYDSLTGDLRRTLNRLGGYPGRGSRFSRHDGPMPIRIRAEPTAQPPSLRAIPEAPAQQGLRAVPEPEAVLRSIPEPAATSIPRPTTAPTVEKLTEQKPRQPPLRQEGPGKAVSPAMHIRREPHQHPAGTDIHASQKPADPTPPSKTHREPNMLPFIAVLVVIAVIAVVMILSFVASQSKAAAPSTAPARARPSGQAQTFRPVEQATSGSEKANDDQAVTKQGRAVTIQILDNDATEADGSQPAIETITSPQNGWASAVRNGAGYRPKMDFSGTDQFQYTIRYRSGSRSTATVTVRVESN